MPLWARLRGHIAGPLLYLGPCRPHLPSPRYFADFPPILRSYPLRARSAGPPRPRFRSYCGRRIVTLARIIRACLCCTSQGAAGGSGMPTLVCSCRDMRRGRSCSVCARGMLPLQAASSPDWVGHDAMMISSTLARVSRIRNFALRASILAVSTRAHERGNKESNDLGLGLNTLKKKI